MNFKHSGDYGDIIYALPTIRAMGGGHLWFGTTGGPRQKLNEAKASTIRPLLEQQPYIKGVAMLNSSITDYVDLDLFRKRIEYFYTFGKTLAEYHLECFGYTLKEMSAKWLITPDITDFQGEVVINRSDRYHNDLFPWKKIVQKYGKKLVFIGAESERASFRNTYGDIRFYKTNTFLDAARVMAAAKLFIGNQSCCYAIAEGLKLNSIQETNTRQPDCMYRRSNATLVGGEYLELPDL